MQKASYLGLDIGSISTKAVLIDSTNGNILDSTYLWTQGDPINAVRRAIAAILGKHPHTSIIGIGTTGSARKLSAAMLDASVCKNEITAHATGTVSVYPDVRTILEIGGQDSKLILIEDGLVIDYAMNTLCAAGTGAFLSSQALRLNVAIEDFGDLALKANRPANIASRCAVFAESDLVHKAQIGYSKEEIIAGLCTAVAQNFVSNLTKGKATKAPIVFQGGVSKNIGVVEAFERILGHKIQVHPDGHLMGALGVALLCKKQAVNQSFDRSILDQTFETDGDYCDKCGNSCELIHIRINGQSVDTWGRRCS